MNFATSAFAQATQAVAQNPSVQSVDFSQLDLFMGLIIGVAFTGILTGLVVWALVKAKVINLGAPVAIIAPTMPCEGAPSEHLLRIQIPRDCNEHKAERERSIRNEGGIKKLWEKYDEMTKQIGSGIEMLHANQLKLLVGLVQSGVLDARYVPDSIGTTRLSKQPT
jgi:hypothetical protein